jgi:hypothetical protein
LVGIQPSLQRLDHCPYRLDLPAPVAQVIQ